MGIGDMSTMQQAQVPGHPYTGAPIGLGGIPAQERLTVQREANDVVEHIQRAHGLLDILSSAPASPSAQQNAPMLALGAAVSCARGDIVRLCERLDSLIQAVGQI